jgi:hypothetical protein
MLYSTSIDIAAKPFWTKCVIRVSRERLGVILLVKAWYTFTRIKKKDVKGGTIFYETAY